MNLEGYAMELKDRLKDLRVSRGYSQKDLAQKIDELKKDPGETNTYVQTISSWENGREPNLDSLKKLSKVYDVTTDYLLGLTEEQSTVDLNYAEKSLLSLSDLKVRLSDYSPMLQERLIHNVSAYYNSIKPLSTYGGATLKWGPLDIAKIYALSEIVGMLEGILDAQAILNELEVEDPEIEKGVKRLFLDNIRGSFTVMQDTYFKYLEVCSGFRDPVDFVTSSTTIIKNQVLSPENEELLKKVT